MTFANPIPWWVLALVVTAAAALSWLVYRRFAASPARRAALIALRFITIVSLVTFLMRPVVHRTSDDTREAVVPILVDTSRSMGIQDGSAGRRMDDARRVVEHVLLPALGDRFKVETLAFGDGVAPAAPSDFAATARRSDLSEALAAVRERYRDRPVAGIVLLSDGGDTSGKAEPATAGAATPVYAMGFGSLTVGQDREVLSVTATEAALDDARVDLDVSAVSHGHGTDPIELRLLENGRPLEVRRVKPAAAGTPVRSVFQVTPPAAAPTVYTVEIPEAAGEIVPENNARSALVQPPSRPRRVLLVEGAPGFEHSFLKRAWSGDRGIEVDSVVRKGQNEQGADTFYIQAARSRGEALASGYPQALDRLFAYDAVVLANVDGRQLTRAEYDATREFVARRGGGLLVLGARALGREGLLDGPLDEVLPLALTDRGDIAAPASAPSGVNRVGLTAVGLEHPIMRMGTPDETRKRWDLAPPLAAIAPLGGARPGASVLAVTGGPGGVPRALVAVQRYGEGRSMIFTGEAAWRWRMLLPSTDRSYETFWRQALRWLAMRASEPTAIVTPASGAPGETLPLRVLARNAGFEPQRAATVDLRVTAPDGRVETLRAAPDGDGFVARFRPTQAGVYRVAAEAKIGTAAAGAATTAILVGGFDLEMTDPRLNMPVLERIAAASGGRVVGEHQLGSLVESLRAAVPSARLAVQEDLWHNGWSFTIVLLLLASEWILRRRWGLR